MLERFHAHHRGIVMFSLAALFCLSVLTAGGKLALERPEWGITLPAAVHFVTMGKVGTLFALGIVLNIYLLYVDPEKNRSIIALLLNLAVLACLVFMAMSVSFTLLRLMNRTTLSGGG